MAIDYIFGVGWAAVLGISISFWPVSDNKKYLFFGWTAKIVTTLGLMLFYESQYTGALPPQGAPEAVRGRKHGSSHGVLRAYLILSGRLGPLAWTAYSISLYG